MPDAAHEFIGRHFMASYMGCDPEALRNHAGLCKAMRAAIGASGGTIIGVAEHAYVPQGFTLVFLVCESHASIHTYPEHNACFADLFTCGTVCRPEAFDAVLRGYLRPACHKTMVIVRSDTMVEEEAGPSSNR